MRRTGSVIIATVVCILAGGPRVQACSCVESGPPGEASGKVGTVFVGQVVSSTRFADPPSLEPVFTQTGFRIRLKVTEAFRGDVGTEMVVRTSEGGGSCGYPFVMGRTYLVYAYRDDRRSEWA